jgi:hypothetical protein
MIGSMPDFLVRPLRGALTTDVGDTTNFALAAFRLAITEWDPSGTFAAGMRAMCEGFEHGSPMVGNGTGSSAMSACCRGLSSCR